MARRIFFDGLNLSLEHGTGIATYTLGIQPSLVDLTGRVITDQLEAMLLGTPVVTSRTSSLPEIAGDAALYVNPYETEDIARAIRAIAADGDLRAELTRRGRLQAEQFSVTRYRERVAALYDRLS